MKYDRHDRPNCTTKVRNISGCISIHDRPEEADGRRSSDRETDTTAGKNGKGAILILTEHPPNFILMEKLEHVSDFPLCTLS